MPRGHARFDLGGQVLAQLRRDERRDRAERVRAIVAAGRLAELVELRGCQRRNDVHLAREPEGVIDERLLRGVDADDVLPVNDCYGAECATTAVGRTETDAFAISGRCG